MEMHTTVKTALAALLLSGGAALAESNPPVTCPPGSYESGGKCLMPNPDFNVNNSNANNIANYNAAVAAAEAAANAAANANATGGNATGGNGYGGKGGAGGRGGAGGKGGNANATGGAGGNASSDQRQGQRQSQRQSSRNDNRSSASTGPISIDNSTRQAANAVYAGQATYTGNECAIGGGLGGSSVGQTFGGNFTVLDKACANIQQDNRTVDRVCTYLTEIECRAVMAYTYPTARAGMIAAGTIRERVPGQTVSVSRHEMGDGSFTRAMNESACNGREC